MNILILGGTSFTGPHLVRMLAAQGHALTLYHRGQHNIDLPPNTTEIHSDLADLPAHAAHLRTRHFDAILHMHAMTLHEAQLAIDAFAGHTSHLVVASSQDVYAPFGALLKKEERLPSSLPISEDSPLRTSRYIRGGGAPAYEKIDVEETFLAHAKKLPVTILRMPPTYGPHDPNHRFFPFLKRIDDKRPAILLDPAQGNFKWSHAYVENVAHAFSLALTAPPPAASLRARIYNIGEGPHAKTPTIAERLHEFARAAKYRGQILIVPRDHCPPHLLHDELDFRHDLIINDAAIRKELGYSEIVPPDEAFRRTIAWQRQNPPPSIDPAEFDYATEDKVLAAFGLLR
ncbi:MAG TPA: NAD-dependent epimerase/dehydratase family protein [Phycisphaerae bacterium]|nr:NAD-dependent epimerase/dehydratase family protein [Phycisphaerae bacterium]